MRSSDPLGGESSVVPTAVMVTSPVIARMIVVVTTLAAPATMVVAIHQSTQAAPVGAGMVMVRSLPPDAIVMSAAAPGFGRRRCRTDEDGCCQD